MSDNHVHHAERIDMINNTKLTCGQAVTTDTSISTEWVDVDCLVYIHGVD